MSDSRGSLKLTPESAGCGHSKPRSFIFGAAAIGRHRVHDRSKSSLSREYPVTPKGPRVAPAWTPVAALPEIKHPRGAREPLSRKMTQVQLFRVAWPNADDKPEFWYPGPEVRFPQSTCAISFWGDGAGATSRRGVARSIVCFFLRKLRDMHPELQKGFSARRAPGRCGRLSEPQGGARATCWDQIGKAPVGNGGEVRFLLDSSGEVHGRKRLAQQASACCLPRRSDQVLQTDNFKRSGVTGASLTSGTHVLPLAGRLAFFGPVRSRPPGGPPDYFRGGRGATYVNLPLSGVRAMMGPAPPRGPDAGLLRSLRPRFLLARGQSSRPRTSLPRPFGPRPVPPRGS